MTLDPNNSQSFNHALSQLSTSASSWKQFGKGVQQEQTAYIAGHKISAKSMADELRGMFGKKTDSPQADLQHLTQGTAKELFAAMTSGFEKLDTMDEQTLAHSNEVLYDLDQEIRGTQSRLTQLQKSPNIGDDDKQMIGKGLFIVNKVESTVKALLTKVEEQIVTNKLDEALSDTTHQERAIQEIKSLLKGEGQQNLRIIEEVREDNGNITMIPHTAYTDFSRAKFIIEGEEISAKTPQEKSLAVWKALCGVTGESDVPSNEIAHASSHIAVLLTQNSMAKPLEEVIIQRAEMSEFSHLWGEADIYPSIGNLSHTVEVADGKLIIYSHMEINFTEAEREKNVHATMTYDRQITIPIEDLLDFQEKEALKQGITEEKGKLLFPVLKSDPFPNITVSEKFGPLTPRK
jgi:hypothetical protein